MKVAIIRFFCSKCGIKFHNGSVDYDKMIAKCSCGALNKIALGEEIPGGLLYEKQHDVPKENL